MGVVIIEKAIDRGLEVGDGSEHSAFTAFGKGCEEIPTALSQEAEVGVTTGFRATSKSVSPQPSPLGSDQ
jgi:hypothetical protein